MLQSYSSAASSRPKVEAVPDELDMWGRPKRAAFTSPTAVLPDDERLKAEEKLAKEELQSSE